MQKKITLSSRMYNFEAGRWFLTNLAYTLEISVIASIIASFDSNIQERTIFPPYLQYK